MATAAGLVVTVEAQTGAFHARMAAVDAQLNRLGRAPVSAARGLGMLQSGMRSLAMQALPIPGALGSITTGLVSLTAGAGRAALALTGFLASFAATRAFLEWLEERRLALRADIQASEKLSERLVGDASGRAVALLGTAAGRMPRDLTQRFKEEMEVIRRQRVQVRQLLQREDDATRQQQLRETLTTLQRAEDLTEAFFELEAFKEFQEQQMKLWQPLFETLQGLMSNFFVELKDEGLSAFASLADNILNIWFDLLAKMAAAKLADIIFDLIPFKHGGAAPGFVRTTTPISSGQVGGTVGALSRTRMVEPSVFLGARHFARGGLVGDEVPVIAHRGETILPRGASVNGETMAVHVTQNFNVAALDARGVQELLLQQRGVIAKAVLDVAQESRAYRVALQRG